MNLILECKSDIESEFFNFLLNEFRTINFYTLKSSFGDTKKFKRPDSLYLLPFEAEQKKLNHLEAIERVKSGYIPDADKAILTKMGYI